MKQSIKKRIEGFTIVEVMIVLAIAGMIILVVLLAIPALQRNSRNTTIKNDASAVAAAINEFSGANNGKMPATAAVSDGTVTISGASGSGTTPVTGKVKPGTEVTSATTGSALGTTPDDTGKIVVVVGKKCNDAGTDVGASNTRSVAVLYNVETSSSVAKNCIDS